MPALAPRQDDSHFYRTSYEGQVSGYDLARYVAQSDKLFKHASIAEMFTGLLQAGGDSMTHGAAMLAMHATCMMQ